jgi:hypothetical protein
MISYHRISVRPKGNQDIISDVPVILLHDKLFQMQVLEAHLLSNVE